MFFVLRQVRHHKMLTLRNYLHEVNSKFKNNRHLYEAVEASFYLLLTYFFFLLSFFLLRSFSNQFMKQLHSCKNQ